MEYDGNETQDISATSMLYYNYYPSLLDKTNAVLDISGALCIGGHIVPDVSTKYDLGSEIKPFRTLYINNVENPGALTISGGIVMTNASDIMVQF